MVRIALANLPFPESPEHSVSLAEQAIAEAAAAARGRRLLPGVLRARLPAPGQTSTAAGRGVPRARVVGACRPRRRRRSVAVVLGTERVAEDGLRDRGARRRPGRDDRGLPGQGAARPLRGGHLRPRPRPPRLPVRPADVRGGDLPRGLALPRDGALGGAPRRAGGVPSPLPRGGARRLPALELRGPRELLPREGGAVPGGGEHLLLRDRQLRERRLADHVGGRAAGRHAARVPALRPPGPARSRTSTPPRPRACSPRAAVRCSPGPSRSGRSSRAGSSEGQGALVASGSQTVRTAPPPGRLPARTFPWCSSAMRCAMASPSPVPPLRHV